MSSGRWRLSSSIAKRQVIPNIRSFVQAITELFEKVCQAGLLARAARS